VHFRLGSAWQRTGRSEVLLVGVYMDAYFGLNVTLSAATPTDTPASAWT